MTFFENPHFLLTFPDFCLFFVFPDFPDFPDNVATMLYVLQYLFFHKIVRLTKLSVKGMYIYVVKYTLKITYTKLNCLTTNSNKNVVALENSNCLYSLELFIKPTKYKNSLREKAKIFLSS